MVHKREQKTIPIPSSRQTEKETSFSFLLLAELICTGKRSGNDIIREYNLLNMYYLITVFIHRIVFNIPFLRIFTAFILSVLAGDLSVSTEV